MTLLFYIFIRLLYLGINLFWWIQPHLPSAIQSFLPVDPRVKLIKNYVNHQQRVAISIYGDPKVSIDPIQHTLSLGTNNKSAGIIFYYDKLDPTQHYQLAMDGSDLKNKTSIHFEENGNTQWLNAETGEVHVNVTGTKNVKWLVYGDHSFQYLLKHVSLRVCPECTTDVDLKNKILHEIPALQEHLKYDQLLAAKEIMNWVANHLLYASDPSSLIKNNFFNNLSAADINDYFDKKQGGVYCGGGAYFLAKIYELFDLPAFTVTMGIPNTNLTHVTVVVAERANSSYRYFIFDPTFNVTFYNKQTKAFASVDELWRAFEDKNFNEIIDVQFGEMLGRNYIISSRQFAATLPVPKNLIFEINNIGPETLFRFKGNFYIYYLKSIEKVVYADKLNIPLDNSFIVGLLHHGVLDIHVNPMFQSEKSNFMLLCKKFSVSTANL